MIFLCENKVLRNWYSVVSLKQSHTLVPMLLTCWIELNFFVFFLPLPFCSTCLAPSLIRQRHSIFFYGQWEHFAKLYAENFIAQLFTLILPISPSLSVIAFNQKTFSLLHGEMMIEHIGLARGRFKVFRAVSFIILLLVLDGKKDASNFFLVSREVVRAEFAENCFKLTWWTYKEWNDVTNCFITSFPP